MKKYVILLDSIFEKYGIKDEKNNLGYRDKFINYVKSLERINLQDEYNKHTMFYEFVELQKEVGLEIDLMNEYTMLVSQTNRNLGQVFTPNCVNGLLSKMIIDDKETQIKKFYDCAGGTGSTVISAYYEWRNNQSFINSFNHLIEIDELDLYNSYCCVFNFILRGLNAIVKQTNTLTKEIYKVFIMTNSFTYDGTLSWFSDYKTLTPKEYLEMEI